MSPFTVAPVKPTQYESLVDLLFELHTYYNDPPTATREDVRAHLLTNLLADSPSLCLLTASNNSDEVVGFAALHLQYSLVEPSPGARRQCVLKELFVSSANRGFGIGELLVRHAARFTVDHGCARMDWNVKASNLGASTFTSRLAVVRLETASASGCPIQRSKCWQVS